MKVGNSKNGNDYNFDRENVKLPATQFGKSLDKIELRYNVTSGTPAYAAAKSLYQWRSVLGYKLGGLMRQAVVKLAEIKRPFINAHNFLKHAKEGSLQSYTKLHSTRDVMNACQQMSGKKPAEFMKYMSFTQFPQVLHKEATNYDTSLGTHLLGKHLAKMQKEEVRTFLKEQNWPEHKINECLADMKHTSPLQEKRERNAEMRHQRAIYRAERMSDFSKDIKQHGFKIAFSNLREQARRDEERFQWKFNNIEPSWHKNQDPRAEKMGVDVGKGVNPIPQIRESAEIDINEK